MKTNNTQNNTTMKNAKNPVQKVLYALAATVLLLLNYVNVDAQCYNCGSNYPSGTTTVTNIGWATRSSAVYGSEYSYWTLNSNYISQFSSNGTSYDTQLTLFPSNTCTSGYALAYNDDYNGNTSLISYRAGTTSVRLLMSQYNCTSNSTGGYIKYRAIPYYPTITASATTVCSGAAVTLSANSGLVDDVYMDCQWGTTSGGTDVASGVASVTVYPTTSRYYYLRYVAYGGSATQYSSVASVYINVLSNSVTAGSIAPSSSSICLGNSVTINSSVNATSGSGTLYIEWYRNNNQGGGWEYLGQNNSQTITNTPNVAGTYTYLRRAWSNCAANCNPTCYDATTTVSVLNPVGNSQSNAISLGTVNCNTISSTVNSGASCYANNYAGPTNHSGNDIWYSMYVPRPVMSTLVIVIHLHIGIHTCTFGMEALKLLITMITDRYVLLHYHLFGTISPEQVPIILYRKVIAAMERLQLQ